MIVQLVWQQKSRLMEILSSIEVWPLVFLVLDAKLIFVSTFDLILSSTSDPGKNSEGIWVAEQTHE